MRMANRLDCRTATNERVSVADAANAHRRYRERREALRQICDSSRYAVSILATLPMSEPGITVEEIAEELCDEIRAELKTPRARKLRYNDLRRTAEAILDKLRRAGSCIFTIGHTYWWAAEPWEDSYVAFRFRRQLLSVREGAGVSDEPSAPTGHED